MASPTAADPKASLLLFFGTLAFTLLSLPDGAASVPVEELDAALAALRSRGYNLAANAVTASDLRLELLSAASVTLFAPVDSGLFALGMALPGPAYLSALRSHAVPRRLSAADLRGFRSDAVLPTLLPSRSLRLTVSQNSHELDGVELAVLGVFYGRDVAVHGLRGALSFPSQSVAIDSAPHPAPRRHSSSIFFRVPEFAPPYPTPEIRPLPVPLPAQAEITSVALMGEEEDGHDGNRRGRYGLPGDPAPTAMPPFNGGGEREGSLKISEPVDEETMSVEEDAEDDDEFWDDDLLLA